LPFASYWYDVVLFAGSISLITLGDCKVVAEPVLTTRHHNVLRFKGDVGAANLFVQDGEGMTVNFIKERLTDGLEKAQVPVAYRAGDKTRKRGALFVVRKKDINTALQDGRLAVTRTPGTDEFLIQGRIPVRLNGALINRQLSFDSRGDPTGFANELTFRADDVATKQILDDARVSVATYEEGIDDQKTLYCRATAEALNKALASTRLFFNQTNSGEMELRVRVMEVA